MTPAIAFRDLTLGYDRTPAVLGLDADIADGSLTAVIGPNGAGKSTLLKGVAGDLAPQAGTIVLGAQRRELRDERRILARYLRIRYVVVRWRRLEAVMSVSVRERHLET